MARQQPVWRERVRCPRCNRPRYAVVRSNQEVADAQQRICRRCSREQGAPSKEPGLMALSTATRLPLPPFPTEYLPGTPEKMALMTARMEAGYHLHHPEDRGSTAYTCDLRRESIRESQGMYQ